MFTGTARAQRPPTQELLLTQRILQVGDIVLPTRNIARFGSGTVPKWMFNWWQVVSLGLFSLWWVVVAILLSSVSAGAGVIVLLLSLGGTAVAAYGGYLLFSDPLNFGLLVVTSSGERFFFQTKDRDSLARVVQRATAMIDSVEVSTRGAQINITNQTVTLREVTVEGVLNTGTVDGGVSVNSTQSPEPQ